MLIYTQKRMILYELKFLFTDPPLKSLFAVPPLKIDVLHIHHYLFKEGMWCLDLRSECLNADDLEVSTMLHAGVEI